MDQSFKPYPNALLNPKVDPIFKALFTDNSKEAQIALQSFLTAILGDEVSEIELLPNELSVETPAEKQSQFDLTCKFRNEYINIEMQGKNLYHSYGKRAEYHVAHLLNHYVTKGMDWQKAPKVYQISVLNFVFDKDNPDGINHYRMCSKNGGRLTDSLNVIFIELTKILKQIENSNIPIEKLTSVQRWVKFFMEADNPEKQTDIKQLCKFEEGIMKAEKVLSKISQDEINWYKENLYWDNIANWNTMKSEAEADGRAAGLQAGHAEGLAQGLEKGVKQEKEHLALQLLKQNLLPVEKISEITGLSLEQLAELN